MRRRYHRCENGGPRRYEKISLVLLFVLPVFSAYGGMWSAEPRLRIKETLTDNLDLSASDERSEAVTQIIPGIAVHQKAGRSTFDADYHLETDTYAREPSYNSVYHNLRAEARQNITDYVSFAEAASVGQQLIDPNISVPSSNIFPGNRTSVVSYWVSPEARHTIAGYVDAEVNYRYGRVHYLDSDAASDSAVSDTSVALKNSARTARLSWNVNYDKAVTNRVGGADTLQESADATLRYKLTKSWAIYAVGGRENNELMGVRAVQNGTYWRAGLAWMPVPELTLQASRGDLSKEASLYWSPSSTTSLSLAYLNQDVGLNPGVTWSGSFRHRTRRTQWQAEYYEQAINVQRLQLAGQQYFLLIDARGNPVVDPVSGDPIIVLRNDFTLTDQDFIQKRGSIGYGAQLAFTALAVSLYDEKREYQISGGREETKGIEGTISWKFAGRTRLWLKARRSSWTSDTTAGQDRLDNETLGVEREMTPELWGSLGYSYEARDSGDPQRGYVQNSIFVEAIKHW